MDNAQQAARGRARLSILDAVLLAPLAAPFIMILLGLLVWGVAQLATDYVAVTQLPAVSAAWWQWPWGWPGPHVVEALHVALGHPSAADLSLSDPRRLADTFDVAGRAVLALLTNAFVALLPLVLALWTIAAVLAVAAVRARAKAGWPKAGWPS